MEVAGVVLGGIPIALYVLDNYKRCLRAAKDIKNYQGKLERFRLHVFIQNQQLQVTLQNIGLHIIDDQLPTKADLKEHLESLYPADRCDKFIGILSEMEDIVKKLLYKLDVDTQGKPRWTREAPDRVCWEWRRVRRGLNTSARDELVHDLQYWNTALSKVFEKPEIPQNEDGPLVQRIQGQFNAKMCNATRKNVSCTYVALAQAWKCSCPKHRGNPLLSWHTDKSARSGPLTLTVSTNGGSWASLTSEVEHDPTTVSQASPQPISLAPPSLPNSQKRKKFFFWSKDQTPVETQTSSAATSSPNMTTPCPEISCLCEFINRDSRSKKGLVNFSDHEDNTIMKHLVLNYSLAPPARPLRSYRALNDFLQPKGPGRQKAPQTLGADSMLSRKERFAIAAAATWAVLYLCGTPWLEDDWAGASTIAILTSPTKEPTISCALKPQGETGSRRSAAPSSTIRNLILFALGVLLTELCLNTTLSNLRQEYRDSSFAKSVGIDPTEVDDYYLANLQLDRVYLDAGKSYGYAVQRCLRCEFPEPDSMKSLEFKKFRELFFNGVVAPVQAIYEMQCN